MPAGSGPCVCTEPKPHEPGQARQSCPCPLATVPREHARSVLSSRPQTHLLTRLLARFWGGERLGWYCAWSRFASHSYRVACLVRRVLREAWASKRWTGLSEWSGVPLDA